MAKPHQEYSFIVKCQETKPVYTDFNTPNECRSFYFQRQPRLKPSWCLTGISKLPKERVSKVSQWFHCSSPMDPATDIRVAPAVLALIPWLSEIKEMQHSSNSPFLQVFAFQHFAQIHGFLMTRMSMKPWQGPMLSLSTAHVNVSNGRFLRGE